MTTVAEIKKTMTDVFINNTYVMQYYNIQPGRSFEDEFSTASIESILFYCLAFGMFILYSFFNLFIKETDLRITNYTHPTLGFYEQKIKTFQFGDNTIPESDYYNNVGLTDAQIAAKKVIKYSAAVEQNFSNGRFGVRIKVAGEDASQTRIQLPTAQLIAARAFLKKFRYAGVYTELTSDDADYLQLQLKVYYNPLVLDNTGARLDGNDATPLQTAINNHLKNLPFNGHFNLTAFTDAMQIVEGIADPRIISAQTKYGNLAYTQVNDEVVPDAGYLNIYNPLTDLIIQWIPKNV